MDLETFLKQNTVAHPSHQHPLIRGFVDSGRECDNVLCSKSLNNDLSYICHECDFDLCQTCFNITTINDYKNNSMTVEKEQSVDEYIQKILNEKKEEKTSNHIQSIITTTNIFAISKELHDSADKIYKLYDKTDSTKNIEFRHIEEMKQIEQTYERIHKIVSNNYYNHYLGNLPYIFITWKEKTSNYTIIDSHTTSPKLNKSSNKKSK